MTNGANKAKEQWAKLSLTERKLCVIGTMVGSYCRLLSIERMEQMGGVLIPDFRAEFYVLRQWWLQLGDSNQTKIIQWCQQLSLDRELMTEVMIKGGLF